MRIPSSVPVPAIKRISDTDNSGGIPAIQRIFSEKLGGQSGEDSDDIWQTSGRRNFADNLGEQSAVDIRRRQSGGYIMSAEFSVGYPLDWISTDWPPVRQMSTSIYGDASGGFMDKAGIWDRDGILGTMGIAAQGVFKS